MGEIDGYVFEKDAFEKTEIFSTYNVIKEGLPYKARIFKKDAISQYNLQTVMEYNKEVFWYMGKYSNMLAMKEFSVFELGEIQYFENYECTLKQYIERKPIDEKQTFEILKDIMRAIHNMFTQGYYPLNIRPQHFVLAKNKWKLRSAVFDQRSDAYMGLKSQYTWDSLRQVPEAFQKRGEMTQKQLQESLVWDIGSIVLNIIRSYHHLTTYEKILKNCQKGLGLEKMTNIPLVNILKKALSFDINTRLKLIELYEDPIFKNQFDTKVLGKIMAQSSSNISTLKFKFQMSKLQEKSLLNKSLQQQSCFQQRFMQKEERVSEQHQALCGSNQFIMLLSGDLKQYSKVGSKMKSLAEGSQFKKRPKQKSTKEQSGTTIVETADQFGLLIDSVEFQGTPKKLQQTQKLGLPTQSVDFQNIPKNNWVQSGFQNLKLPEISPQTQRKFLFTYKQEVDKADLCAYVVDLIQQIPFKTSKNYWQVVAKFILEFQGAVRIRKLAVDLNSEKNCFNLDPMRFQEFSKLSSYRKLKQLCNDLYEKRKKALQNLRIIAQNIKMANFTDLRKPEDFQQVLNTSIDQMTIEKMKPFYKRVLGHCYSSNNQYYKQTHDSYMIFLNMFMLLAASLDKIFVEENQKENWAPLYKWQNKQDITVLELKDILEYMEKADREILRIHMWDLASKWFQLTSKPSGSDKVKS